MTYPLPTWVDNVTALDSANFVLFNNAINGIVSTVNGLSPLIPFTTVQTASVAATANQYVLVSTASSSVTVSIPTAPPNFTVVGVKQVIRGGTNTVTVQLGGTDTFDVVGGSQAATLTVTGQAGLWQYNAATAVWVKVSDDLPLSQLDGRYVASVTAGDSTITMGGTTTAPTVKVAQANLTVAESQVTGLSATLNASYSAGGQWAPNVYGTLFENMERDDANSTLIMGTTPRTQLVQLGLVPAGTYSTFKTYTTNTPSGGVITAALFSSSTMSGTSWARLGSGNVTPSIAAGLVSTSLSFTLSSPAYVLLQMVYTTTATTYASFAASSTGATAVFLNPTSGAPVSATSTGTSAPGTTLNPTTGFTAAAQKIWAALA
jgi:hypothetical protein